MQNIKVKSTTYPDHPFQNFNEWSRHINRLSENLSKGMKLLEPVKNCNDNRKLN